MRSINTFSLKIGAKNCTQALTVLTLVLAHFWASAQCISSIYCPVGPDTFCQYGKNDPQFWKADYWKDTIQDTKDLYEAPVDVNITVLNTCGNTDQLSVRYQLYLDLNQDGVEETIIDSDQLPKGDTVYFGNNITTSTALPYRFDFRAVIPELRYRFALQKQVSGDTLRAALRWNTAAKPTEYVLPKLPGQGKCRIVWTIQNGTETQRCERVFQVRDCEKPQVECYQGLQYHIQPYGQLTCWAFDLLNLASDNLTNWGQLEYSIRKKGTGNEFPVDKDGKAIPYLTFACNEIGRKEVELWIKDRAGNTGFCATSIKVDDGLLNCGRDFQFGACAKTLDGDPISDVIFKLRASTYIGHWPYNRDLISGKNGCANTSHFITYLSDTSKVTAHLDENPLNGISTYDLVLISKHILGLEPIKNPLFKIAADANGSNSITTLDIVELRKLILGINIKLIGNTSWRFFTRACCWDTLNFPVNIPEYYSMVQLDGGFRPAEFIGIKIGDVNGTTAKIWENGISEDRAAPIPLQVPDPQLQAGEILEIPLHLNAKTALNGFQFDLQFNPQLIDIQRVTPQNIQNFSAENYSRSADGSLRVSWADARAQAGATLVLRLRALAPVRLSEALAFADQSIHAEAYSADNAIHPLQLQFEKQATKQATHIGEPWPNPSATGFTFDLQSNDNEQLNLQISDLSGRVVYQTGRDVPQGASTMTVPTSALPQAGVYGWRVQLGSHVKSGKLVVK